MFTSARQAFGLILGDAPTMKAKDEIYTRGEVGTFDDSCVCPIFYQVVNDLLRRTRGVAFTVFIHPKLEEVFLHPLLLPEEHKS